MKKLVHPGRPPIKEKNIRIIIKKEGMAAKTIISQKSDKAELTLIGLREEMIKHEGEELFVHSKDQKTID